MYPTKKLSEICEILDRLRKPVTASDRVSWPYPYYGATGIQDYVDKYIFDEDLVLVWEDWAKWNAGDNTAFKITGKSWVNNHAHVLRLDKTKIEENWFINFLNFSDLSPYITGATVKKLNQERLRSLDIPLPPLSTQFLIVEKLDEAFRNIDKQIALLKQNIEDVENVKKSFMGKAFEIWRYEMKRLSEVCNKITDGSHNPPKWIESWIPMISSRNLEDNNISFDNIRFISEEDYIVENKRTCVDEWDILLSIVWTIWKVCIVRSEFWRFTMQRSLSVLKINQEKVLPFFIYYYLNSDFVQKELNDGANGAAQKWIYLNQIKEITIPLPPLHRQYEIVAHLDTVFDKSKALRSEYETQIQDLETLKQSLLEEAFAGRLVKE